MAKNQDDTSYRCAKEIEKILDINDQEYEISEIIDKHYPPGLLTEAISKTNKLAGVVHHLEETDQRLHVALDSVLMLLLATNGYNYDYNAIDQALDLLYEGFNQGYPLTTELLEKIRKNEKSKTSRLRLESYTTIASRWRGNREQ